MKKVGVIAIYFLLWLGCFQLKDALFIHSKEDIQRLLLCFFAGIVFAFFNGFKLFKVLRK